MNKLRIVNSTGSSDTTEFLNAETGEPIGYPITKVQLTFEHAKDVRADITLEYFVTSEVVASPVYQMSFGGKLRDVAKIVFADGEEVTL